MVCLSIDFRFWILCPKYASDSELLLFAEEAVLRCFEKIWQNVCQYSCRKFELEMFL